MGDRANVLVKDGDSKVYLYTHWDGTDLPNTVKAALVRGVSRWDDGPYLARIIFCEMVNGVEMETVGYGISSVVGDGAGRVIELDVPAGEVRWNGNTASFSHFVTLNPRW